MGGGAGAVSSGIATKLVPDLDSFRTLLVMLIVFLVAGCTHAFAYLHDSPLPAWNGMDRRASSAPAEPAVKS